MLSDTLSNYKLNQGEYSKYQVCSSKFGMAHVYILFLKDNLILNGPSMIQGDQDALGHPQRLRKINHGEFSKYHLCPSKIDMAHVHVLFYKDLKNIFAVIFCIWLMNTKFN